MNIVAYLYIVRLRWWSFKPQHTDTQLPLMSPDWKHDILSGWCEGSFLSSSFPQNPQGQPHRVNPYVVVSICRSVAVQPLTSVMYKRGGSLQTHRSEITAHCQPWQHLQSSCSASWWRVQVLTTLCSNPFCVLHCRKQLCVNFNSVFCAFTVWTVKGRSFQISIDDQEQVDVEISVEAGKVRAHMAALKNLGATKWFCVSPSYNMRCLKQTVSL